MLKKCSKCGAMLPTTEYHKNPKTKDGYYGQCKDCCAEYQRAYRAKNRDAIRKDKKAYVESNREVVLAKKRAYAAANRGKETARAVQWAKDNPERVNENNRIRRFRARAFGGKVTKVQWAKLCELFNHKCAKCGEKKRLEMDHIVPVVLGGAGDISNVQPLCRSCNASKNTTTIDYRPQSIKGWARKEVAK